MGKHEVDLVARFRPLLEAELAELAAMSRSSTDERAPVELDQQSVGRLARMDAMQVQAMALASERRRQARVAALKAALSRLDEGEYGYCESCGDPIPEGRLKIDLTARVCMPCARREER